MNLRELAHNDAANIFEGEQAGNTLCDVSAPDGTKWQVLMLLSDIGYMTDGEGNPVAGRSCWATYIGDRIKDENLKVLTPQRGWKVEWTDLEGCRQKMFVSYVEPDKTIALKRLYLEVSLKKNEQKLSTGIQ